MTKGELMAKPTQKYLNTREALLKLAEGEWVRRKDWGGFAYLYMDSFGFIRKSGGYELVNWNEYNSENVRENPDWECCTQEEAETLTLTIGVG